MFALLFEKLHFYSYSVVNPWGQVVDETGGEYAGVKINFILEV
jgi:hypothetical protein